MAQKLLAGFDDYTVNNLIDLDIDLNTLIKNNKHTIQYFVSYDLENPRVQCGF